jgi:hypothetical protein
MEQPEFKLLSAWFSSLFLYPILELKEAKVIGASTQEATPNHVEGGMRVKGGEGKASFGGEEQEAGDKMDLYSDFGSDEDFDYAP